MRSTLLTFCLAGAVLGATAPAHAGAGPSSPPPPAVSVASDGTAAYAYPGAGLLVSTGSVDGALGAPAAVAPAEEIAMTPYRVAAAPWTTPFWVVAEPGGGARALWVARLTDFTRPDFRVEYQLRSRRLGGPVEPLGPAGPVVPHVDVSANPSGSVLAVWDGGGAFATAGSGFSPIAGDVPADAQAALAPGGAALIAGHACGDDRCPVTVVEAPDGRAFGPPRDLPDSMSVAGLDAALASDGSALIAGGRTGQFQGSTHVGPSYGPALAFLRRGGGDFALLGEILHSIVGAARAGVAGRGRGVVTVVNGGANVSILELPGDGSPGRTTHDYGDIHLAAPSLAVREDGAALVGTQSEGVLERGSSGGFERRPPVIDPAVLTAVALGERGSLIGWPARVEGAAPRYLAQIGGKPQELPYSAPRTPPEEYPQILRPRSLGFGLAVMPGPIRVRGGRALVPVYCHYPHAPVSIRPWCPGSLAVGDGKPVDFGVPAAAGRYIRVPVGRRRGIVRLTLHSRRFDRPTTRPRRRLVRRPRRSRCDVPPWARTVARGGGRRIVEVTRWGSPGASTQIVACGGGRPERRLLTLPRDASLEALPALISGGGAAFFARHAVNERAELTLHVVALGGAGRRSYALRGEVWPLALAVGRGGGVAVADGAQGRVRIRALTPGSDRVLDIGPGIDEDSLEVRGNRASWTRDGTRQNAELAGP